MSVGVVIGRFQVASLHEGHLALLEAVAKRCRRLVVMVGTSGAPGNLHDPLPYFCREDAIRAQFPKATVIPLVDCQTDEEWSQVIDMRLRDFEAYGPITIFGSRDSALAHYTTKRYPQEELPTEVVASGTVVRDAEQLGDSLEFRQGLIFATKRPLRFPTSYQAVDIAVRHQRTGAVLLGQKPGEAVWRFPGGFVDPSDASLEAAARRELQEECGAMEVADLRYVGSARIPDWRYRGSVDAVMSALFVATHLWGAATAGDDLARVNWFQPNEIRPLLAPAHADLWQLLQLKETQPR